MLTLLTTAQRGADELRQLDSAELTSARASAALISDSTARQLACCALLAQHASSTLSVELAQHARQLAQRSAKLLALCAQRGELEARQLDALGWRTAGQLAHASAERSAALSAQLVELTR
jgi:hypothetical protein